MRLRELISYMSPSIAETANRHMQRLDEMQSKIDSMMINLGTPTLEPLVNTFVYEESDDDIEVTLAYTLSLPFIATIEPTDTLLMADEDTPLFDEEFEDISSLDLPELTPVIDEPTLLETLPLSCTDVLGDAIVDIDLPLGEPLDTLSTGDREINFNPSRDIEELERLLADDPVLVPRVFDDPFGNSDSMSRSSKTSDLFEELIAEIGLDNSNPIRIDDRYYDLEGDILFFEQLLNKDTSSDVSLTLLPTESSSLVLPLPDPRQVCLREVERFDPFFSLTQSGSMTWVIETPSFGFHHMPSPRPVSYSPKEVMYRYYHPHLTPGDGFDPKIKKIPYGESKVHIEVLSVLWENRLPIPDGALRGLCVKGDHMT
ncbi:hypothetical protein Tco_0231383 [Tanacetum coccineum]